VQAYLPGLLQRGLFAEALERIAMHRASGHRLVLMSASADFYVPQIGAALGFDQTICTVVRWHTDGRFDGRLTSANCRGEEKSRQLLGLQRQLQPAAIIAYGNSRADLAHMLLASEGWYVNGPADPLLNNASHIRAVRWHRRGGM
jgi:phosphatidylglycerophosphatase C